MVAADWAAVVKVRVAGETARAAVAMVAAVWVVVVLAVVVRGLLIVLLRSGSAACAATRGRPGALRFATLQVWTTRGVDREF